VHRPSDRLPNVGANENGIISDTVELLSVTHGKV